MFPFRELWISRTNAALDPDQKGQTAGHGAAAFDLIGSDLNVKAPFTGKIIGITTEGHVVLAGKTTVTESHIVTAVYEALQRVFVNAGTKMHYDAADYEIEGYTFLGSYKDEALTQKWDLNTPINASVTLYPAWLDNDAEETTYTLTLNANGGIVSPPTVTQAAGTTYILPTPIRSGYFFTSWVLSGGGSLSGNTYHHENLT